MTHLRLGTLPHVRTSLQQTLPKTHGPGPKTIACKSIGQQIRRLQTLRKPAPGCGSYQQPHQLRFYRPYSAWHGPGSHPHEQQRKSATFNNLESCPRQFYEPLDSNRREIRLLRILGVSEAGPIECSLDAVSLDDADLQFTALSYVWGDQSVTKDVMGKHQGLAPEVAQAELSSIGFKRVWGDEYFDPETERVWEAARLGVGTGLLPIWVDAICINQDDPEEKGHQVQMMHKIYSKAWLVLSWLGSASETKLDLALKTIRDLAPRTRDFPNVEWIEDFPELRVDDRERCEPDWVFPNPSWDAIRRFSDSDYFTRLWILPELWASQRCNLNLFICGEEHLHYNHLDEFQFWRARSRGTRDPLCAKIPWWGKYQSITPKFQIILGVVSAGKVKEEKLLDFLWFVGHCHCQDPRDKIFGLIEPFHMSVVPDYTMPVRDVWLNWAKDPSWNISPGKLLQISGSSLRSRPDVNYDLPSWLPDLTLLGEQLPSIGFSDHDDDVPDRFKPTISELNSVHCYGLPISTIREIVIQTPATFTSGVLPSKIRDVEFLKDISNLLRSIIEYLTGKKSPDPSHPCYDRNTQLWNLLQVLHMGERKPVEVEGKLERLSASYSKQIIISSFIEKLRSWTRHAASDSLEQIDHIISEFEKAWDSTKFPRDANNTTDLPHPKQGTPDYDLFFGLHVGAIHSARNQSFFHTTCGRLGTGPAGIQEQDRIFLIHGSSQPLVLREVNGEWTNVGACYVKGFADDDALEILANREDEVHSINIV